MSSVSRGPAQRLTKQLVVLATGEAYTQAGIVGKLGTSYSQVGNAYLLSYADFDAAIGATGISTAAPTAIAVGDSLRDLGKDLYVGILGGDSQLLHFRLVQPLPGIPSASGINTFDTVYVLVQNKVKAESTNLAVAVARV